MTAEEIRERLKELIKTRKTYDESTSEANISANLVEPLFALLGWNTADVKQVDRQSYVRGAGYPDIALKIDNNAILFVEVKRIGKIRTDRIDPKAQLTLSIKELADLIDRTPEEKQAFKYARGKEIRWAILTNFDCLYVFNADQERIILSFKKPEEYLEKLDDLLQLSRHKVKADSLQWVQDRLKKEEMDKSFLEKLKTWRVALARNIYNENTDNHILKNDKGEFDLDKLMGIVQRVLSRLMIIQIADDREVLKRHNLLENLIKTFENMGDYTTKDHLLKKFIELSEMMDKHHNTTIFTPGHPCDNVFIANSVLDNVIKGLCNVSFRKMSADILGATYESYLGYRFSIKNGKIEAEIDQRVRKQAGIYYTPSYIVRYIVDNTLGVKLKELEEEYGIEAGERAKDLKVLDPACGSGSFLIYAFDVLAGFYERLNYKITEKQVELSRINSNSDMFERQEQFKQLPPRLGNYPKKILEDHLYGVDLDPAACEIATINLVIKAFEKMRDKKLPLILNQNVKVGNSLISGVERKEDLEKFKDEIVLHVQLRTKLKQTEDDEEKRQLIGQIDQLRDKVNSGLNESLTKHFDQPDDKRSFNWEFEFPEVFDSGKPEEQKGFDVVIGNPPWIESKRMPVEDKGFFEANFHSMRKQYDIFNAFVEKGVYTSRVGGALSYIVPSRFLMNPDYEKFREFLVKRTRISQIVDAGEHIFKNVEMPALILVSSKESDDKRCRDNVLTVRTDISDFTGCNWNQHVIPQSRFFSEDKFLFTIYLPEDAGIQRIITKVEKHSAQLSRFVDNARGVEIGKKSKVILDQPDQKNCVPFLTGEDIDRYLILGQKFLRLGVRNVDYKSPKLYKGQKILIRKTGTGIRATYDNSGLYVIQVIYILKLKKQETTNIKYILGFLNSKFLNFYYFLKFGEKTKKVFPHLRQENVLSLPVPRIDSAVRSAKLKHDALVKHVGLMLQSNKQKNEQMKTFEQVLDNHPHELQPFGKAYYEKAEYVKTMDKKATSVGASAEEVTKIFLEERRSALVFSVLANAKKKEVLRIQIPNENLRLFLFYSIRKYLEANKRRKKWTTKSYPKVLDVLLGRLEVPIFKAKTKVYDPNHNLKMIDLVMREFKAKFRKKFPKGGLHLTEIEKEIQDTDNSIDALVFRLYNLNKNEVTTVLDSMETPEPVKKDILKKFSAMK